jgi:hypothetical protein
MTRLQSLLFACLVGSGCADRRLRMMDGSGSSSSETSPSPSTSAASATAGDEVPTRTSTSDEGGTTTGGTPSCIPDPPGDAECDPSCPVCGDDMKCAPVYTTNSDYYDSARCVPVAPEPRDIGEPCEDPFGPDGLDDCVPGAICDYGADGFRCVELCMAGEQGLTCSTPDQRCTSGLSESWSLKLCAPFCDPLEQQCALEGSFCMARNPNCLGCFPLGVEGTLACLATTANTVGLGQPCAESECDAGLFCVPLERAPICDPNPVLRSGCCTPHCDLNGPDTCPDETVDLRCVPLWLDGAAPAGYEHVGVCAVP